MKLTFFAIPSGDLECFCFDVSRSTFEFLTKREPNTFDKSVAHKGMYKIYPSDIFELHHGKKLRISIEFEEKYIYSRIYIEKGAP